MLPITVAAMFLFIGKSIDDTGIAGGIICMIQLVFLISAILPTERALKRTFDEDGNKW